MRPNGIRGLVSVIIPTFNRKQLVRDAVNSVYWQTYRPIELILVDDGSTDGTREALEVWMAEKEVDSEFTLRYLWQANSGPSAARNLGLIESTGEYIQFLDSDDILLPTRLDICVKAFEQDEKIELVHGAFSLNYGTKLDSGIVQVQPASFGTVPSPTAGLWTAAGLFKREVLYEAGPWNEEIRICEDTECFTRVLAVAEKASVIQESLVIKRKRGHTRLADIRWTEHGLRDKMHAFKLQERTYENCGVDINMFAGKWHQLTQDALVIGSTGLALESLSYSAKMSKTKFHWYLRWLMLKAFSSLPPAPAGSIARLMNWLQIRARPWLRVLRHVRTQINKRYPYV